MITKNCKICNKYFQCPKYREHTAQFCCQEHRYEWQRLYGQRKLSEEESKKLYPTKYKHPIKIVCIGCGKEFEITTNKSKRKYCSRECGCHYIGKLPTKSWATGLDKTNPKIAEMSKKVSETLKRKYQSGEIASPWNKGLTKETNEILAETAKKLSEIRQQEGKWKENWRESMRKGQVKAHSEGKYQFTFTIPEQLTWKFLESKGFNVKKYCEKQDNDPKNTWYHQYPVEETFVADFAYPINKTVIEVNGCFIHGHNLSKCKFNKKESQLKFAEENIKRDKCKRSFYQRNDWKWILLWECNIKNNNFETFNKYWRK